MRSSRILAALTALGLATGAASQTTTGRATFVLTDGERISGDVTFDPDTRTNMRADRREFTLAVDGTRKRIAFDRVVLIEFTSERPPADELEAVPIDGHLLSMRDGELRRGRLVDLIGGDTVRWEREQGGRIDVPLADVSRVFLQGNRARTMYDVRGRAPGDADAAGRIGSPSPRSASAGVAEGPSPSHARMTRVATLVVRGALPWTDSRINVRRGDVLVFEASGRVFFLGEKEASATPEGNPAHYDQRFPIPETSAGALIGKIGAGGDPFVVTATPGMEVVMPATGRLFLGINDHEFADNTGGFHVRIKR
jgi:hypothetical protein